MKVLACLLLLSALALATADTDVSGKWSGTFNMIAPSGETNESTAWLVLKQNGGDITGTAGPNESEQYPITKGKIDGNKITIEVDHEGHVIKFDLVLADERIKGEANMTSDQGETRKAKLDVGRVK